MFFAKILSLTNTLHIIQYKKTRWAMFCIIIVILMLVYYMTSGNYANLHIASYQVNKKKIDSTGFNPGHAWHQNVINLSWLLKPTIPFPARFCLHLDRHLKKYLFYFFYNLFYASNSNFSETNS